MRTPYQAAAVKRTNRLAHAEAQGVDPAFLGALAVPALSFLAKKGVSALDSWVNG